MADRTLPGRIWIAAALIDDDQGRLLLVRKRGTHWFMQAGGKVEQDETALSALRRELNEEIGFSLKVGEVRHLGLFSAPAANEPDCLVEADIFHVRMGQPPAIAAEIEEALWVHPAEAEDMPLAPLTREHVLPLARMLASPQSNSIAHQSTRR